MDLIFLGNSIKSYLISIGIFTGLALVVVLVNRLIVQRLKVLAGKTSTRFDDVFITAVERSLLPLLYFAALYAALRQLDFEPVVNRGINAFVIVVLTVQVTRFVLAMIMYFLRRAMVQRSGVTADELKSNSIFSIIRFGVWALAAVFMLDNLGFNVSAVVAGLGIGGVAVALAAQTILGDLFNYFVIFFDKPFKVGDFIIINEYLGTIEHIGIKSTRIRSLGGELLIFSNSDLTGSRVRNYKRMDKRRVLFSLGVIYQTTHEQLQKIPAIIRQIIEKVEKTEFDRAHFKEYGNFSLNFEIVYYVQSPDYNVYMDIQQQINLAIYEAFAKEGIEFAYPTQTLFMTREEAVKS